MEIADIITIAGAFGGIQGVIELLKYWRSRHTTQRQEVAAVVAVENENRSREIDRLEKRVQQRDEKVDAIHMELRAVQKEKLQLMQDNAELRLQLKEAEIKKCVVRGCGTRKPSSEY